MLQKPFAKRTQNTHFAQSNNHQIKKRQKRPKKRLSQLGSSTMPHTQQISLKRPTNKKATHVWAAFLLHKHFYTKSIYEPIQNIKVNQ